MGITMRKKRIGVCVFAGCGEFIYGWPHHRKLQSHGGSDNDANLCDICFDHHNWVHAHPEKAIELGLIIPEGTREPTTKLLRVEFRSNPAPKKPQSPRAEADMESLLFPPSPDSPN